MSIRVKICGLRRPEDVDACVEAGVNACGFNFFAGSPRRVTHGDAAALIARLPLTVLPVGVFVGTEPDEVKQVIEACGIRAIQLHGDEDPALFAHLPVERIQVFRVAPDVALPERVSPAADWVMLDTWVQAFGGQGRAFDWGRAVSARARYDRPLLVAGGLNPENIGELLVRVRPDGVDVASGVEVSPGVKDPKRILALMEAVREFEGGAG